MRFHEGHHGDFEWDESAFPDPKGMIDELRSMGFKLSLWESPLRDIGGFFGFPELTDPPSPELYIRWAQMGLLFSHARAHGHTAPREPWAYGDQAMRIFRRYDELRYQLLPYLYGAALEAAHGKPIVRPLVYDHWDDPTTHQIDDQYFLGQDLLVAPMFEAKGARDVYLPEGAWYDYWSDQHIEGKAWIRSEADLDKVPVFVRAGAVIPKGPVLQHADERPWHPFSFDVYPNSAEGRQFTISDGATSLQLRLITEQNGLLLEASKLDYRADVRVHLAPGKIMIGHLGERIRYD
jgi:alpha-D-xyloside xylohydrolase